MKKFSLFLCLTTAILLFFANSCKKDVVHLSSGADVSVLKVIAQLPASQIIQTQEIKDWIASNAGTDFDPAWDKAMQSVVNGHHVIYLQFMM